MNHPSWFGKDMLGDEKSRELWERMGQAADGNETLQVRAFNAAMRNGVESLEQLEAVEYATIREWRNVGEKVASVIFAAAHPRQPKLYFSMPDGFHVVEGATTAPNGYRWIAKGSFFDGSREHGLISEFNIGNPSRREPMALVM